MIERSGWLVDSCDVPTRIERSLIGDWWFFLSDQFTFRCALHIQVRTSHSGAHFTFRCALGIQVRTWHSSRCILAIAPERDRRERSLPRDIR